MASSDKVELKGSSQDSRVHIDNPNVAQVFQENLSFFLNEFYDRSKELIILCIGTDRSAGDSLAPFVGTKLLELGVDPKTVYGTLDDPVHAVNLQETIELINTKHSDAFIIAMDACLGRSENIGYLSIKKDVLHPGTGVGKNLPTVGDLQITGIVNVGGFMEYEVLANTRLSLIYRMAEVISKALCAEILNLERKVEALACI